MRVIKKDLNGTREFKCQCCGEWLENCIFTCLILNKDQNNFSFHFKRKIGITTLSLCFCRFWKWETYTREKEEN